MNLSIFFALSNGLIGLGIGFFVSFAAFGEGWKVFPVFSTISALLVSFFFHFLLQEKFLFHIHFLIMGSLVAFLSHYFTFYFFFVYANLSNKLTGGFLSSLGEPPAGLLDALWVSGLLTFFSLFMVGWLTFPLSCLTAYLFRKGT